MDQQFFISVLGFYTHNPSTNPYFLVFVWYIRTVTCATYSSLILLILGLTVTRVFVYFFVYLYSWYILLSLCPFIVLLDWLHVPCFLCSQVFILNLLSRRVFKLSDPLTYYTTEIICVNNRLVWLVTRWKCHLCNSACLVHRCIAFVLIEVVTINSLLFVSTLWPTFR